MPPTSCLRTALAACALVSIVPLSAAAQEVLPAIAIARPATPLRLDRPRLRLGVSTGGGLLFAAQNGVALVGWMADLETRLGAQINRTVALYWRSGIAIGAASRSDVPTLFGPTHESLGALVWSNSAMLDFTLADVFQFAIGPTIDVLGGIACVHDCAVGGGGGAGAHSRIAVQIGRVRPDRRSGFTVGVDLHGVFTAGIYWTALNVGYEMD